MKSETEVIARLNELRANIQLIEERMREELETRYLKRDYRLLRFLYKEKSTWEFAIEQMEWLLSDK